MRAHSTHAILIAALVGLVSAAPALAYPDVALETKATCATCHVNPAGGTDLTDAGKKYKAEKKAAAVAEAKSAKYVGSAKCKMCHAAEFKAWTNTAHANAYSNLKAADKKDITANATKMKIALTGNPTDSAECVRCHVTGYGLAGGFPEIGASVPGGSAEVAEVGCESCHGPGSIHLAAPKAEKKKSIYGAVGAKMCLQCHVPSVSPEFNLEEMVTRGVHPKPAG